MRSKYIFLSTIISAGIISLAGNSLSADHGQSDMPKGGGKCFSGNPSCPNRIESVGGSNEAQNMAPPAKKLKTQSAEKFKGVVDNVKRERYPNGRTFIQITLKTNEGDKTVLVGPANYVDQSKVKLQIGDKVTVLGFPVQSNGEEIIMAKEIDKNGNVLKLLNDQRQPLWGGQGNQYRHGSGGGYRYNNR